jgi:DNA-binding PadR family transcriptional regulator
MAAKGWVEAEWGLSENNRRAKYYRLTPQGRRELEDKRKGWAQLVETVTKALAAPRHPKGATS